MGDGAWHQLQQSGFVYGNKHADFSLLLFDDQNPFHNTQASLPPSIATRNKNLRPLLSSPLHLRLRPTIAHFQRVSFLSLLVHPSFAFSPTFSSLARDSFSATPSPDCRFCNFMGNCLSDSKKLTAEIVPQELIKGRSAPTAPAVRLYGSPTDNLTSYIRFALLYKSVKLSFVSSETPNFASGTPAIQFGSETVSGSRESMLQYIEARFPHPPLTKLKNIDDDDETSTLKVVRLTEMQHRSIIWHAERITRWAEDLATRGGKRTVDPSLGSPRMEIRKFGKSYSQLLEVMLEHAQMEERVLFPVLDMADRGICKGANEEHARDLPMMNGIKEDIKSIGVLDPGSSLYHEALSDLSKRLKSLQGHCKQHFAEEEKNLLPLVEATEVSREKEEKMIKEIMNVMQGTHSHLLNFLLEGLLPEEAMDYLDFIST